jgi:mRNA interferase RelE/StbE
MFSVELSQRADKFYNSLDEQIQERVKSSLKRLEQNQVPSDAKFVGRHDGEKVFRIRIGDYRALYKVKESAKIILVTKIDKRSRVYGR